MWSGVVSADNLKLQYWLTLKKNIEHFLHSAVPNIQSTFNSLCKKNTCISLALTFSFMLLNAKIVCLSKNCLDLIYLWFIINKCYIDINTEEMGEVTKNGM